MVESLFYFMRFYGTSNSSKQFWTTRSLIQQKAKPVRMTSVRKTMSYKLCQHISCDILILRAADRNQVRYSLNRQIQNALRTITTETQSTSGKRVDTKQVTYKVGLGSITCKPKLKMTKLSCPTVRGLLFPNKACAASIEWTRSSSVFKGISLVIGDKGTSMDMGSRYQCFTQRSKSYLDITVQSSFGTRLALYRTSS